MTTLEARIAEVVSKHIPNVIYYNAEEGHVACHGCDWSGASFTGFYDHQAAMLAPVIREAQAEALREAADKFQRGDWFNVIEGNAHVKIGNGQRVTDWLRARSDNLATS